MRDILVEVLTTIACLFVASMLIFCARLFHQFCERLKEKTKNEAMRNLINKIDYIVQLCVETTNQTFVNDKKDSGNFTDEDKEQAFNQTIDSVTNMLPDEDRQKIINEFGDLGTFLKNSIENYIKQSKNI
jgi:hypothetical protein